MSDKDRLINDTKLAKEALEQADACLEAMLTNEIDPNKRAKILAKITRTQNDVIRLEIILRHLKSASTIVQPIDTTTLSELDSLADKLDEAIVGNAIFDANLEFVLSIIESAKKIGSIADSQA